MYGQSQQKSCKEGAEKIPATRNREGLLHRVNKAIYHALSYLWTLWIMERCSSCIDTVVHVWSNSDAVQQVIDAGTGQQACCGSCAVVLPRMLFGTQCVYGGCECVCACVPVWVSVCVCLFVCLFC